MLYDSFCYPALVARLCFMHQNKYFECTNHKVEASCAGGVVDINVTAQ
jgi:hypothetical protein